MIESGRASSPSHSVTDITTSGSTQLAPSASPSQLTVTQSPETPPTKAIPSTSATSAKPDKITSTEDEVTRLINVERGKAGCGTVRTDERLRTAARAHSADMAKNNYFSHTGRDGSNFVTRAGRAGYPESAAAGENIAYGYSTAQAVVNGWMNSDGHRRNILNCSAKATGLGLAYRGSTPYWTQIFGRS